MAGGRLSAATGVIKRATQKRRHQPAPGMRTLNAYLVGRLDYLIDQVEQHGNGLVIVTIKNGEIVRLTPVLPENI